MKKQTVAVLSFISDDGIKLTLSTVGIKAAPSTRIISYTINWGFGVENYTGAPPQFISRNYDETGNYQIHLTVTDSKGTTASASITMLVIRNSPIIIEPDIPSRGPQPGVTAPAGAIILNPGDNIQTATTVNAAGTTFFLNAGVYPHPNSGFPITPKSGNIYIGQYGAILDGAAWSTGDLDDAAFRAVNNGITGVQIKNLYIRNMPEYGINAYLSSSGWKIDHCEIYNGRNGVSIGVTGEITNNIIHDNVGDTGNPNPALRGGGFAISQTTGVLFDNNEVYRNGTEQKFIGSASGLDNLNFVITNNYFHNNVGNGCWSDGYGAGGIIENNISNNNGQSGVVIEKGKSIIIRNNTVNNNTESGILNSESRDCEIHHNTLDGNAFSLDLFVDLDDVGTSAWGIDLLDNSYHHNTVTVPDAPSVNFATVLSHVGVGDFIPYTNNSKNNDFDFNTYNVHSSGGNWWNFGSNINWTSWQALPQDPNGTRNII